jgi:peptide/nickel transport system substrate-binding protein
LDHPVISRRAFVAALLSAGVARALSRKPYGGVLRLELPLSLEGVDPHAADDPASALLAPAVADPLFAVDANGRPYPALAASLPEPSSAGARVMLRPGLVTARGAALGARDVIASLERARRSGARAVLAPYGAFRTVGGAPLGVDVEGATPDTLAMSLASPLTAIVPRSFRTTDPDGTGAFRAVVAQDSVTLERNERAARGPAYLDRIEVRRASDLASGLRAFEAGDADIGFLGAGLHRRRALAVDFRTDPVGFVVLRTGALAGTWGAPGVAARLVAGLDPSRFSHLGLSPRGGSTPAPWGGASADLLVDEGAPYLVEIARVVAAALTGGGHEIRPAPLPERDLRARRDEGKYVLAVDFVRRLGPGKDAGLLSLLAGADPKLADRPPRFAGQSEDSLTRTLPLAVLGELALGGARAPSFSGIEQWDLGAVFVTSQTGAH